MTNIQGRYKQHIDILYHIAKKKCWWGSHRHPSCPLPLWAKHLPFNHCIFKKKKNPWNYSHASVVNYRWFTTTYETISLSQQSHPGSASAMVSPAPLKVFPERSKELSFNLEIFRRSWETCFFCGVLKSCKVHALVFFYGFFLENRGEDVFCLWNDFED